MRYRRRQLNGNHPIHRQVIGDGGIRHIKANGMAMAGKIGEMVGATSDGIPIRVSKTASNLASFPPTEGECFRLCVSVIH